MHSLSNRFVAAIVVHNDDAKRPSILLPQKRLYACRNVFRLIARRNNRNDGRPMLQLGQNSIRVAHPAKPEIAAAGDKIEPHHDADDCAHEAHWRNVSACIRPLLLTLERTYWFGRSAGFDEPAPLDFSENSRKASVCHRKIRLGAACRRKSSLATVPNASTLRRARMD